MYDRWTMAVDQIADTRPPTAWSPLRHRSFRHRWLASIVSNLGTWMQDTAATWLMTILTGSPFLIALMQTAASLPVLVFGLPSGALADILDRRKVLIFWQSWMLAAAVLLSALTMGPGIGPWTLLVLTLLLNVGAAMNNPAWQAIVPELVPRQELAGAISLNSAGYNLARAVGPALGGIVVALFASVVIGAGVVFLINAVSFIFVIAVLFAWDRKAPHTGDLPAERLLGSIRAGLRYVRHDQITRGILARTFLMTACVSAMWALLAVVAQHDLGRGALGYGILNGSAGLGAVIGALLLPGLRHRLSANTLVTLAGAVFAAVLLTMAFSHSVVAVFVALLVGGFAWTTTTSTFNIAMQMAAPPWVQARLLGLYQMTFHAGMALGSAAWGLVAEHSSTPVALAIAAAGLVLTLPLARRFRILAEARDLSSFARARALNRWDPAVVIDFELDDGPVMISVDYEIDVAEAEAFTRAINALRAIRMRDGAIRWGLFRDAVDARRYTETFLVESWAEYLRQRERMTMSDRAVRDRVYSYQRGLIPPPVSRKVYVPTRSGGNRV